MLSEIIKATIRAFVAKFPLPDIGTADPRDPAVIGPHEDRCRDWMFRLAQQLTFSHPQEGFGRKRADPGRPWSKDNLPRRRADGQLEGWDLMLGAGTGHPTLNLDAQAESLAGQHFETVSAVDHLGSTPPPPPPPPPTGDLALRVTTLEADMAFVRKSIALLLDQRVEDLAAIRGLQDAVTALLGRVDGLSARVDALPAAQVKKGDPIEVRGTISVPLLGSRTIISRGTL